MNQLAEITIKKAEIKDADILTETCKKSYDSDSEVGAPGPGGPPGYDSLDWNLDKIKNRYLQYHKILNGDEIVGGFIVGDRGPGYQVCERIWVDPDYMRKGIGARTFHLILDTYPSADLWALGTPEWNTRTNPFYQKIGFVQIGTTHEHSWNGVYYEKRITDGFPKAMSIIGDLHNGHQRVLVDARVDNISSPRTVISRKTGEELKVADLVLSDDTGSIKLVLWNDHIRQVKANTNIRIEEGYVKEFRDELQLSIGKWGTIITLL
ncbi:MAG: GNAT family N-acetyltransferase [Candidatus Thorarchaeota archaeon]|nr:GNAT family N-acetyltransferase [Candidatus Thorarchaeota archaeon]MCK5238156.1 GNAT family N-acetyltransferase [Candidatus Thorarchaeota archaeon]